MPQTPKTSIALYRTEQVEAYEHAKARLEREGELPNDPAEGDYLAALAEQYVTDETDSTATQSGGIPSWVKAAGAAVVVLLMVAVVLTGFAFALTELGIM